MIEYSFIAETFREKVNCRIIIHSQIIFCHAQSTSVCTKTKGTAQIQLHNQAGVQAKSLKIAENQSQKGKQKQRLF